MLRIVCIPIEAIPWELKQIFDKSVQVRQIDVCENLGIMIFLTDRGRVNVFRLTEFSQILNDSNCEQDQTKTRSQCKDHRLEFVSGCSVYALNKLQASKSMLTSFKFVAACGKHLLVIESSNRRSPSENICEDSNGLDVNNNSNFWHEYDFLSIPSFQIKKVTIQISSKKNGKFFFH